MTSRHAITACTTRTTKSRSRYTRYPIQVNGKETNFEVIPEVYTSLRLSLDGDNLTLSSYNVTGYDMAVMDAVCTMYEHGCTIFTPAMLLRMMTGKDS